MQKKLRRVFMVKRVSVAAFLGVLCGVICMALASYNAPLPWPIKMQIITNRALMGVAIGVSALKMKWWVHGLLMGLLFSLPLGFSSMMAMGLTPTLLFTVTVILGMVYGLIIELFTTVVFKAES
jgi:hypothetical protein